MALACVTLLPLLHLARQPLRRGQERPIERPRLAALKAATTHHHAADALVVCGKEVESSLGLVLAPVVRRVRPRHPSQVVLIIRVAVGRRFGDDDALVALPVDAIALNTALLACGEARGLPLEAPRQHRRGHGEDGHGEEGCEDDDRLGAGIEGALWNGLSREHENGEVHGVGDRVDRVGLEGGAVGHAEDECRGEQDHEED